MVEHCHTAKSLCRVNRHIPAVFPLMCGSNQLSSVTLSRDRFIRFKQLIVDHTTLIPPNAEHKLGSMDIWLRRWCWWLAGLNPWLSPFGIVVVDPLFISSHNSIQKSLAFLSFKQLFTGEKTPFHVSWFQFVWDLISLLLDHSHDSQAFADCRKVNFQWFS